MRFSGNSFGFNIQNLTFHNQAVEIFCRLCFLFGSICDPHDHGGEPHINTHYYDGDDDDDGDDDHDYE